MKLGSDLMAGLMAGVFVAGICGLLLYNYKPPANYSKFVAPEVTKRTCGEIKVSGIRQNGMPIVWYECRYEFSDGTHLWSLGDLKPDEPYQERPDGVMPVPKR